MRKTGLLAIVALAAATANVLVSCTSDDSGGVPAGIDFDAGSFDGNLSPFDSEAFVDVQRPHDSNAPTEAAADVGVGDDAPDDVGATDTGTPDEGIDTGVDAGFDAGVDAGFDAGSDASDGAVASDAGPTYTHFVYAVGGNSVEAYHVDESTGALGALNETPDAGTTTSLPIANNPLASTITGNYLYTANAGAYVSAFSIAHGRLTRIASGIDAGAGLDYPAGSGSRYVVATSKFLFTANETGDSISRFSIGAGGTLTPLGDVALPAGSSPKGILLDPTGTFLFSFNYGLSTIEVFKIDASGGITAVDQNAGTAGQQDFPIATGSYLGAAHPTLNVIYVSAYATSAKVASVAYDANGVLSAVGTAQTTGSNGNINPLTFSVAVDPSGTHLYAVNYEDAAINVYTIDQGTGALTAAGNGTGPSMLRAATVDPSGAYLFVCGDNATIKSYAISGNTLTPVLPATSSPSGGYTLPVIVSP